MCLSASAIAFSKAFPVLAFIFIGEALILHIISIGIRSGLYGDKVRTVVPAAMIGLNIPFTLRELKLFDTTLRIS